MVFGGKLAVALVIIVPILPSILFIDLLPRVFVQLAQVVEKAAAQVPIRLVIKSTLLAILARERIAAHLPRQLQIVAFLLRFGTICPPSSPALFDIFVFIDLLLQLAAIQHVLNIIFSIWTFKLFINFNIILCSDSCSLYLLGSHIIISLFNIINDLASIIKEQ